MNFTTGGLCACLKMSGMALPVWMEICRNGFFSDTASHAGLDDFLADKLEALEMLAYGVAD